MRKLIIQSEANDDMLKMLPALLSSASREPQRFWPTPILAPEWGSTVVCFLVVLRILRLKQVNL